MNQITSTIAKEILISTITQDEWLAKIPVVELEVEIEKFVELVTKRCQSNG